MKEKLLGEVRQSPWAEEETLSWCAFSWNRVRLKLLRGVAVIFGVEKEPKPSIKAYSGHLLADTIKWTSWYNLVFTAQKTKQTIEESETLRESNSNMGTNRKNSFEGQKNLSTILFC